MQLVSRSAAAGAVLCVVLAIAYVALILRQGEGFPVVAWLVTGLLLGAAALAFAGARSEDARRRFLLLWAAASILFPLGYFALFSIGIVVVAAGVFVALPAVTAARADAQLSPIAGLGLAVVLLAIGIAIVYFALFVIGR